MPAAQVKPGCRRSRNKRYAKKSVHDGYPDSTDTDKYCVPGGLTSLSYISLFAGYSDAPAGVQTYVKSSGRFVKLGLPERHATAFDNSVACLPKNRLIPLCNDRLPGRFFRQQYG